MSPPLAPEAVLCATYREQAACYRRAVALAESLPALIRSGDDHAAPVSRILALLADVVASEERGRAVKEQWVRAGIPPGAELRATLTELTHLIEQLACSLARAEQEATACRQCLGPEIDTLIRGRAMRRAYGF
jgi:hypothetical protein